MMLMQNTSGPDVLDFIVDVIFQTGIAIGKLVLKFLLRHLMKLWFCFFQFAEILGVTTGAVYKWESGMSVPDLKLIVEMADFFDISVDVLLGYRMKDNHLDSVVGRLYAYCQTMDPAALTEAEKALGKYPHSFRIVNTCAEIYMCYGGSSHEPRLLKRAAELLEQARILLPQNDNPRISELTVCGHLALVYIHLGEREKALELLRQNNADAHFSDEIGLLLAAYMNRPEEAAWYLSEALVKGMGTILIATLGYVFVYRSRGDWDSALAIMTLISDLAAGMRMEGRPGYMDKTMAEILTMLAYTQAKAGMTDASLETLRQAAELSARFDSTPEYTLRTMRFLENKENTTAFDILGATAAGSVEHLLKLLGDEELSARWKEMTNHEG